MPRQRITGHSPYEPVFGFSRAVAVGDRVLVAGTAPVPPGGAPPPGEPYAQARLCLDLISEALTRAGTSLEHVVRTRMYITDTAHWPQVARAHGEVFADIRPAATAVIVAGLLDPAWLVEIEAEAVRPDPDTANAATRAPCPLAVFGQAPVRSGDREAHDQHRAQSRDQRDPR